MRKGSEDPSLAWGAGTLNHRWPLRLPQVFVDAAHLGSVGRNITAATTLGMAQHHEEAASDVNNLQVGLICFFRIGRSRSFGARVTMPAKVGICPNLTGSMLLERVEINDHATLALRDLFRPETAPVSIRLVLAASYHRG